MSAPSSLVASGSRNPGQPYSEALRPSLVAAEDGQTNAYDIYCPLGGCRCLLLRKGSATLVARSAAAVRAGICALEIECPWRDMNYLLTSVWTDTRFIPRPFSSPSQLEHPSAKPTLHANETFPLAPSDNNQRQVWLVTSPLAFENIGFTKGVVVSSSSSSDKNAASQATPSTATIAASPDIPEGASIRYLSCADCDCGPLGWHVESRGSDLGRDVEAQIGGGAGKTTGPVREFLLAVERCRYKV